MHDHEYILVVPNIIGLFRGLTLGMGAFFIIVNFLKRLQNVKRGK